MTTPKPNLKGDSESNREEFPVAKSTDVHSLPREVLENIAAGLLVVEPNMRVSDANDRALHLFGDSREKVVGSYLPELLNQPAFCHALANAQPFRCVCHPFGPNGQVLEALTSPPSPNSRIRTVLLLDLAGSPDELPTPAQELDALQLKSEMELLRKQNLAYAADLAKSYKQERQKTRSLTKTQEQLARSAKLATLGQMVAAIAHDLGNLLSPISGYASLLLLQPDLPENSRNFVARIHAASERTTKMLQSLKTFGMDRSMQKDKINLEAVISASVALMEYNLKKKAVILEVKIESELPKISGNQGQLEQILVNLMVNAQHAMEPNGGTLRITAARQAKSVRLKVSDTGHGIPPQIKERIFEPFFTTKEAGKGTGLGLFICHEIIDRHGGTLEVHSESGKGTTFEIALPIAS